MLTFQQWFRKGATWFSKSSAGVVWKKSTSNGKKNTDFKGIVLSTCIVLFGLLLWGLWKTWQILKILNNWVEEIWMDSMKLIKLLISIYSETIAIHCHFFSSTSKLYFSPWKHYIIRYKRSQDFAFAAFSASFLANLNRWCCQGSVLWVTSKTNLGVSNLRKTHVFFSQVKTGLMRFQVHSIKMFCLSLFG